MDFAKADLQQILPRRLNWSTVTFAGKDQVYVFFFSRNEEEHLKHLENVIVILKENNLRLSIKKGSFMQSSVELLGHVVNNYGVLVDEEKISKIKEISPPTTRKELRSLFVLVSYDRRFLSGFESISKELDPETSEKVTYVWTEDTETHYSLFLSVSGLS